MDLFAGIGCVAEGFAATGRFETLALVDVDEAARDTFLHHHRIAKRDGGTDDPSNLRTLCHGHHAAQR
jgi:site-specific DNA-cytosine methylase